MGYNASKDPIPRGQSWPLKQSLLDPELKRWGVADLVYSVAYMHGARRSVPHGTAIRVNYIGTRESVRIWRPSGGVEIRIYSVPSATRMAAQSELLEIGLQAACQWIAQIAARPDTWQWESHFWLYQFGQPPIDGTP